jgi:hypothetical protein
VNGEGRVRPAVERAVDSDRGSYTGRSNVVFRLTTERRRRKDDGGQDRKILQVVRASIRIAWIVWRNTSGTKIDSQPVIGEDLVLGDLDFETGRVPRIRGSRKLNAVESIERNAIVDNPIAGGVRRDRDARAVGESHIAGYIRADKVILNQIVYRGIFQGRADGNAGAIAREEVARSADRATDGVARRTEYHGDARAGVDGSRTRHVRADVIALNEVPSRLRIPDKYSRK